MFWGMTNGEKTYDDCMCVELKADEVEEQMEYLPLLSLLSCFSCYNWAINQPVLNRVCMERYLACT